jgi:hypothetical protein
MIVSKLKLYNMDMCPELNDVITLLNTDLSDYYDIKICEESRGKGRELVSPKSLNVGYNNVFEKQKFKKYRPFGDSNCEIDFFKNGVGVEIQFGKYAFVFYDIFSKFRPCYFNKDLKFGVEVIPTKTLLDSMSTGPANFELEVKKLNRSKVDFPLAVLGIDLTVESKHNTLEDFFG